MTKLFSRSTGGFYSSDVHSVVPTDAVEISEETWQDLLTQQSQGKRIVSAPHGYPVATESAPTTEEMEASLLMRRDSLLKGTDWLVARHRDEVELGQGQTTLNQEQYNALLSWRRALRNLPSLPGFPGIDLPERPV